MLKILAHSMMFNCKENSVEDNAECDNDIKECVIDDSVQNVLCFQPTFVVQTTCSATITVAIVSSL